MEPPPYHFILNNLNYKLPFKPIALAYSFIPSIVYAITKSKLSPHMTQPFSITSRFTLDAKLGDLYFFFMDFNSTFKTLLEYFIKHTALISSVNSSIVKRTFSIFSKGSSSEQIPQP